MSEKSRYVREKLRGRTFLIPSFVTVVGIFCGFLAIIAALKGRYEDATKCIALAFVLDGLDGRIARKLNATSAFGREFDSLSDLVAFGVAPSVLVYCWAFDRWLDEFGVIVCFLFVACGATRLARFNISETSEPKQHFTGLPIPGAAAAITSIVYSFPQPMSAIGPIVFLLFYMAIIGVLMVTTLPFFSLKKIKLTQGNPALNLLLLSIAAGLAWKFPKIVILFGCNFYALSGVAAYLQRRRLKTAYGEVPSKEAAV